MNHIQKIFQYEGNPVRTILKDGETWFVAKDVCDILSISKYRDAVSRLDDDERGSVKVDTPGGQQNLSAVNEYGLYDLVLSSRKPEAKQFKRWVTHEVLPTIRKTGSYTVVPPKTQAELSLQMAQVLVDQEKRINELEASTAAAHHRIDNFDKIDVVGDLQQRLNKMIRRYAANEGLTFQQAWRNFRSAFNTAYRTNITMLIENYKLKHGIKRLTLPEYLSEVERLDDAIRVADKLLNKAS